MPKGKKINPKLIMDHIAGLDKDKTVEAKKVYYDDYNLYFEVLRGLAKKATTLSGIPLFYIQIRMSNKGKYSIELHKIQKLTQGYGDGILTIRVNVDLDELYEYIYLTCKEYKDHYLRRE